mgnify:CR=1 FL=1
MTTNSTTNPDPVFDHRYVAYVFNQRGYHINEFASRLDMSNNVVEAFLRGTVEPGDLRVATLAKAIHDAKRDWDRVATLANMANLLGIPLRSMFTRPAPAPDPVGADPQPEPGGNAVAVDAEQLLACVYDTGRATPTLVSELAKAFGWTIERTYAAATEADRRLKPAGLSVKTSHGELFVTPVNEHLDAQKALNARKVYERGLTYNHYRAAYQILAGQQVTVNNSARQRVRTLGGLVNVGVVTQVRQPALTEEALEAFL